MLANALDFEAVAEMAEVIFSTKMGLTDFKFACTFVKKLNAMASSTETGHAKNIANLNGLNEVNAGFGVNYQPSNPLYVLATMQAQYTSCNALQGTVNTQSGIFKPLVNARVIEFKPVKPLVRRVRSAAKSCGASDEWVADVNTIVTKILGERAQPATPTPGDPAGTSSSQQSYDNTVNNFQALVALLAAEPLYMPNEVPLKVVTLTAKHTAMNNANNAVKAGVVPYNNAVIARNKALYTTKTGLVDVGQGSKEYVRSTFGFSSPEFKLVVKFKFKKLADVD